MLLKPFDLHKPQTLTEACRLFQDLEDVKILAGGTFLLNNLKFLRRKGTRTPRHVISLAGCQDLRGITRENHTLVIRAMTTISELFESPLLTDNCRILRTVCRNISTTPIRNMATVGGNLTCRYTWTEMGAVMIALNATLHFIGTEGTQETISAEDFFSNAAKCDKIFSHVSIPISSGASTAYRRVRKTLHVDIPLLAVCIQLHIKAAMIQEARVAVNNGVAFAQRDATLEGFLQTTTLHPGIAEEALDHLDANIYDKRSDDYKKHIFRISIKDALKELLPTKQTT